MNYLEAIIIGIVEGLTEFLPVSSTGHMIVVSSFLGIEQTEIVKAYEIIIQSTAILAIVVHYRHILFRRSGRLWQEISIAALPILLVGFLFRDHVKELFVNSVVAWMFITGGVVFLIVEYHYQKKVENRKSQAKSGEIVHDIGEITFSQAIVIGFVQVLSLIPGTSRAGATIIGGMCAGLTRVQATVFSFLLAIPVIGVVTAYDLIAHPAVFSAAYAPQFFLGFVVAFVVAYATVIFLERFVVRHSFVPFGIYRIVVGLLLLMFFV